jgi:hypothetical protein
MKSEIGEGYISVSARFLDALGDFKEIVKCVNITKEEQEELIISTLKQIENLHHKFPEKRILVNSDSTIFVERAKSLSYVFVNPGVISHVDTCSSSGYEANEKTFLDFLMIANAERIYLLCGMHMRISGYPYAASLLYSRPYEIIMYQHQ